jgi:hypothetical protein
MQPFSNEATYPELCLEVGLDCHTCVKGTATESAKVCPGLTGKAIGQLFVLLYPNSACAHMHHRFADEYCNTPGTLHVNLVPRKQAARVRAKSRAAIA